MKKILFLAYPLNQMKPEKDTTLALILGALQTGNEVHLAYPDSLELWSAKCFCMAGLLKFDDKNHVAELTPVKTEVDYFDQVWVRMDPPFDRSYFYTTLQLDFTKALVINSPRALRDWNEKLSALFFAEDGPDTLITNNLVSIREFSNKHKRITLKPIDGFGGKGISFTRSDDPKFLEIVKTATHQFRHKIVVQEFLPEADKGDLRVLIWNGKVLGGILRVHAQGKEINNLDAGGEAVPAELSPVQLRVSQKVAKKLKDEGILFSGIDFLGDKLTEINVTSPTGIWELSKFSGRKIYEDIFLN